MKYTKINANGQILGLYSVEAEDQIPLEVGEQIITGEPTSYEHYWDSAWVAIPAQPSANHTFNWTTKVWEDLRVLADIKAERNMYVNLQRAAANSSYFEYSGKQIAVDALSRSDIDGTNGFITLTGTLPPGWPGGWKAMDNTYVSITTVGEWAAFYGAMVYQGTVNFAHAQTLKAAIAAATTIAEVEAIVW